MRVVAMLAMLLWGLAGFCIFLFVLNRHAILIRDSRFKTPFIAALFLVIAGGLAWIGWTQPSTPWMGIPFAILLMCLLGEFRRLWIRHRCRGSAPIDSIPHQVGWFRPFTTTDVVVHRYEVRWPSWRGPRFRIVHLSDLHVNPKIQPEYFRKVLATAEEVQADYAFLTGDFVTRADALPELEQVLRPLAKRGTFAVLGNHDHWADADGIRSIIRRSGVTLLDNETFSLELEGHRLALTGVDFPWGIHEIKVPQTNAELHFVLSHTPDNIYRLSRAGVSGVFSGHYHAGQIRVPMLGSIVVPSLYGRRFDHGHFVVAGTHLFVAGGIGAANPPIRIYCQPDIFIVDVMGYEVTSSNAS
jgi:predicted MPP superfamily phosphohydrolase